MMDAQSLVIFGALCLAFAIFLGVSQTILGIVRRVLLWGGAVALLAAGFMVVAG